MPTCVLGLDSEPDEVNFFSNRTMDQNMNKMVKALAAALIMLRTNPICTGSEAKIEKNAPSIWNKGAPGG